MKVLLISLVSMFQVLWRKVILVPMVDIMEGTNDGRASIVVNSCKPPAKEKAQ